MIHDHDARVHPFDDVFVELSEVGYIQRARLRQPLLARTRLAA